MRNQRTTRWRTLSVSAAKSAWVIARALIDDAAEPVEPRVLVAGVGSGAREVHHGERDVHFRSCPFDHRARAQVPEGLERGGSRGVGTLAREACRPAHRGIDAGVSVVHRVAGRIGGSCQAAVVAAKDAIPPRIMHVLMGLCITAHRRRDR